MSPDYSTRLETRNKVLTFVNGDIREARCQHHEVGCCSSADDPELAAKEGFFAACVEANLFLGEENIECRKNQWGTMDDALTKETPVSWSTRFCHEFSVHPSQIGGR